MPARLAYARKDPSPVDAIVKALDTLTPAESGVLRYMCCGYTNKEIARIRKVEFSTVQTLAHNIYVRLGAKNRTAAVVLGIVYGGITPKPDILTSLAEE